MWTSTDLSEKTSNVNLPATWEAVGNGLTYYKTFLYYTIPTGMVVVVGYQPLLLLKLYNASGVEATKGRLLIGLQKPNQALLKAWNQFSDYSIYNAISWTKQMNIDYQKNLVVDTGYDYCLCFEGEKICFQIYDTDIDVPASAHASTRVKMKVSYIHGSDLLRLKAAGKPREGLVREKGYIR